LEFKSYIIKTNEDKTTNNTWYIVAFGIIACLAFAAFGMYSISTFIFTAVVIIILVVAFVKKGNIQPLQISKEQIVLTPASVRIDQKTYKISEISEIVFIVHSFNGMNYSQGGKSYETSNGMDNYLSFSYLGLPENCQFYLNSKKHALDLCAVLREYYRAKIPIIEKDMNGGRTWLLKRIETKAEFEIFKTRHKIP